MRNLRSQLLASHALVLTLLLAVMVAVVLGVLHLGRSIDRILEDNYRSVVAAQEMEYALAQHDSAVAVYAAGEGGQARRQFAAAERQFRAALFVAAHNITEPGEQGLCNALAAGYEAYAAHERRLLYASPPTTPQEAGKRYAGSLKGERERLSALARRILDVNQAAIVAADARARSEARRVSLIAGGATVTASLAALLVALRMVSVALAPLLTLARQAERVGAGDLDQAIVVRRSDEVGVLASAFAAMVQRLREARRQEEMRLHRAERMSDEALESLYDPVVVTDGSGIIVHLNRAASGLFGAAAGAAGIPVSALPGAGAVARAVEQALRGGPGAATEDETALTTMATPDGERVYRVRAGPMQDEDGTLLGAVAVLEDVTRLRELDRMKTEFIGVASHELRTPVTSLLLSVQLLQEGAAGELSPAQAEVVDAQWADLQRLERITRDLLDITRLETGRMRPVLELVDASAVGEAAVAAVAAQAQAHQVRLEARPAPPGLRVRADASQLARALTNLLANGVRHTPAGGRVVLAVCGPTGKPASVTYEVRDEGPGIPAEYLPRIFDRFVQVPGSPAGGAGLGLAIARTIVRSHGGEITVESTLGSGSTFRVCIPAAPGAEAPGEEGQ